MGKICININRLSAWRRGWDSCPFSTRCSHASFLPMGMPAPHSAQHDPFQNAYHDTTTVSRRWSPVAPEVRSWLHALQIYYTLRIVNEHDGYLFHGRKRNPRVPHPTRPDPKGTGRRHRSQREHGCPLGKRPIGHIPRHDRPSIGCRRIASVRGGHHQDTGCGRRFTSPGDPRRPEWPPRPCRLRGMRRRSASPGLAGGCAGTGRRGRRLRWSGP